MENLKHSGVLYEVIDLDTNEVVLITQNYFTAYNALWGHVGGTSLWNATRLNRGIYIIQNDSTRVLF